MQFTPVVEVTVAIALLAALALSFEAAFRIGRRASSTRDGVPAAQLGAVQGAVLGLLGLLLGFSFGGASGRFMERQDLIVRDSNAISTAYLRAELLDEPFRSRVQEQLAQAVDARIEIADTRDPVRRAALLARLDDRHARLWSAAAEGASLKPVTMVAVLPPVNEVLDMQITRLGASAKHLPALVLWLLVACSVLSMVVIGYGCGLSKQRALPMTMPLVAIVGASLWAIVDLEQPRIGLIKLDDSAMVDLQRSMRHGAVAQNHRTGGAGDNTQRRAAADTVAQTDDTPSR